MKIMSNISLPDAEVLFSRLVAEIQANHDKPSALIGIHTGGAWLAERLYQILSETCSLEPLGLLSASFYRDDFDKVGLHARNKPTEISFSVDGAHILLIDDVLQTGRTIRAAINELFDYGRPASISLAALVDRGGRELPICAKFIGTELHLPKEKNLIFDRDEQGQFYLRLEDNKGVPSSSTEDLTE